MSLKVYLHPLSSYCWKVLIALYENGTPFEPLLLDVEANQAELKRLWPIGKMPLLRDEARDHTVPETSIIIEYLARHYPGPQALVPSDPDASRQARLRDRFYDNYVMQPMIKVVSDRLRPEGAKDAHGVAEARANLRTAYGMIDQDMADKTWATGETFGIADCAAFPALFYADKVEPLGAWPNTVRYLKRLSERPSITRVLAEAAPYFSMFPQG